MPLSNPVSAQRGLLPLAWDVGLALSLLVALAVVFAIDRSTVPPPADKQDQEVVVQQTAPPIEVQPVRRLRLGVTPDPPQFDDMGRLLTALGEGYKYQAFPLEEITLPKTLAELNVVFLTCSGVPQSWLSQRMGKGERAGLEVYTPNEKVLDEVKETLRNFVSRGGTLYASDLHYVVIAHCFPEFVDMRKVNEGKVQTLTAEVVDPGLKEVIGPQLPLSFDQPGWRPAAFRGEKVTVYLRGKYRTNSGDEATAPLLVRFPLKDGTVIFTSFHNEKQNNETESKLLRYLVFTAVTADVESRIARTMVQGGFAEAKPHLFSASNDTRSVTRVYRCTKPGHLQFVLGFQNVGATLRLTVTDPDGKRRQQDGDATITIDIPAASAGDWSYTVTALKVPSDNFPFVVTIGEK
jgi:hypothetical protein